MHYFVNLTIFQRFMSKNFHTKHVFENFSLIYVLHNRILERQNIFSESHNTVDILPESVKISQIPIVKDMVLYVVLTFKGIISLMLKNQT